LVRKPPPLDPELIDTNGTTDSWSASPMVFTASVRPPEISASFTRFL
jgi:hypothetical protein